MFFVLHDGFLRLKKILIVGVTMFLHKMLIMKLFFSKAF